MHSLDVDKALYPCSLDAYHLFFIISLVSRDERKKEMKEEGVIRVREADRPFVRDACAFRFDA